MATEIEKTSIEISEKFLFYNVWPLFADGHIIDFPNEHYLDAGVSQRHSAPEFNPYNVKEGDVVFVKTNLLDLFFQRGYPYIKHNFILLSGIAGMDVDKKFKQFLKGNSKIIRWIGTNIVWEHPRVIKIPIGFEEIERDGGNQEVLEDMYKNRKNVRNKLPLLAITYLSDTHESRRNLKKFFKGKDFVHFLDKLEFKDYLNSINDYRFVLCPRGCGTDTHRFWEIVFTGSIPVLESSGLDDLYNEFPCIIVDSFQEVTRELIENFTFEENKEHIRDKYLVIENLRNELFGYLLYSSPHMDYSTNEALSKYLEKSENYYEFGSGGSTCLAVRKCVKNIKSVESDEGWYEKIRYETTINETKKHVFLSCFQKEVENLEFLKKKLEDRNEYQIEEENFGISDIDFFGDDISLKIQDHENFIKENQNFIKFLKEDNSLHINIKYVDIGAPLNNWGRPEDESKKENWEKYPKSILEYDEIFDLILVDGRFRVACALCSLYKMDKNSILIFDDYVCRKHYHVLQDFFYSIETIDDMKVFKKKDDINFENVDKMIEKYKYICN